MGQCLPCPRVATFERRVFEVETCLEGVRTTLAQIDQRLEDIQMSLIPPVTRDQEECSPSSDTLPRQECAYGEFVLLPLPEFGEQ